MIPEINDILVVIHFIGYVGLSSVPMHKAWLVSIMEVLDPGDDIVSFPFPLFSFLLFNSLPGWRGRGTGTDSSCTYVAHSLITHYVDCSILWVEHLQSQ